ncbi:MAG: hypothetical protein MSIBF_04625 [Candidatus Altiarchaeales archaeon IMC4]|nr:MAG: hypothetical protein MSIBF_04625 [Candidatus Altiarchaeales archaeon IMC4]
MVKEKTNILGEIGAGDAFEILMTLAKEDKHIRKRIEQIAKERLSRVDLEDVASDVYLALNDIEVEDLWQQSGSTRYGYVEPTERAYEMFGEELEPFMEELKKYQKLSMNKEAKTYCMGILKGIYQFEKESTTEFADWAVDDPKEYFESVLDKWGKETKDQKDMTDIEDFIKKNMPDWYKRVSKKFEKSNPST